MNNQKATFAAWSIMLLLAALTGFIFFHSRVTAMVICGIFAVYGFISCGFDLAWYLGQTKPQKPKKEEKK